MSRVAAVRRFGSSCSSSSSTGTGIRATSTGTSSGQTRCRSQRRLLLRTPITKMLGIRHPIIQGGLNHAGSATLSAAVANAGGLGTLTSPLFVSNGAGDGGQRSSSSRSDLLREEIRSARSLLRSDCPGEIGVNLTILEDEKEKEEDRHRHHRWYDDYLDVLIDENVRVVETSGLWRHDVAKILQRNGVKVLHKCSNLRDAKKAELAGADAILLDGFECSGIPLENNIGNWVLQASASSSSSSSGGGGGLSVPFVASGGVGNGLQLAAALALGASGVNMGTRFLATKEATAVDDNAKSALVARGMGRTAFAVGRASGGGASPPCSPPDSRPHGVRLSVWSCGSVAGLINDVPTCESLINRMVDEAVDAIENRLPSFCVAFGEKMGDEEEPAQEQQIG